VDVRTDMIQLIFYFPRPQDVRISGLQRGSTHRPSSMWAKQEGPMSPATTGAGTQFRTVGLRLAPCKKKPANQRRSVRARLLPRRAIHRNHRGAPPFFGGGLVPATSQLPKPLTDGLEPGCDYSFFFLLLTPFPHPRLCAAASSSALRKESASSPAISSTRLSPVRVG